MQIAAARRRSDRGDLAKSARLLQSDPELFQSYFDQRASALAFDVAAVVKKDGRSASAANSDPTGRAIAAADFADADAKQPLCGLLSNGSVFVVVRPIDGMDNSYLYAGRAVDPTGRPAVARRRELSRHRSPTS